MITITEAGISRSFDIDEMLYNNTIWLGKQVQLSSKKFEKVAKQLELRQEDWDLFWKRLRGER